MNKGNYYAIYADDKEEKIAELEEEIERLRKQLKSTGGSQAQHEPAVEYHTLTQINHEIDFLEGERRSLNEKIATLKDELDVYKKENAAYLEALQDCGMAARDQALVENITKQLEYKNQEIKECRALVNELQRQGFENLSATIVDECKKSKQKIDEIRKQCDSAKQLQLEAETNLAASNGKLKALETAFKGEQKLVNDLKGRIKQLNDTRADEVRKVTDQFEQRLAGRTALEKRNIEALHYQIAQLKIQASIGMPAAGSVSTTNLTSSPALPATPAGLEKSPSVPANLGKLNEEVQLLHKQINTLKAQNMELMDSLSKEASKSDGKVDANKLKAALEEQSAEQAQFFKKKIQAKDDEIGKLTKEMRMLQEQLKGAAQNSKQMGEALKEVEALKQENVKVMANYHNEITLRKKYYNTVQDMKGKIRVFCRIRPLSNTEIGNKCKECVTIIDDYSIQIKVPGQDVKEFQFDRVFGQLDEQPAVFEDTSHLIQSTIDGYNVCIFAYGQTGSGKTHTLVGNPQNNPGIAIRSFNKLFENISEPANSKKYTFAVSTYMIELYNDKLLDLLSTDATYTDKLEIKRDSKGMVFVAGAVQKSAGSAVELTKIFEQGLQNRHVAATKMNSESSRSHLIISIVVECINKLTKESVKGKLSVIDLAGSERVSKSGVTGEGIKEANAINMSLSALGDVIAALTSEQSFIPYRNNKLTQLMQDSLGGNAKTLMFVNASPADYNASESASSLIYASRVKLIKNDATKNTDNEEIAKLKKIIIALKKGEKVDYEV